VFHQINLDLLEQLLNFELDFLLVKLQQLLNLEFDQLQHVLAFVLVMD
jgi:hypothetical protein